MLGSRFIFCGASTAERSLREGEDYYKPYDRAIGRRVRSAVRRGGQIKVPGVLRSSLVDRMMMILIMIMITDWMINSGRSHQHHSALDVADVVYLSLLVPETLPSPLSLSANDDGVQVVVFSRVRKAIVTGG